MITVTVSLGPASIDVHADEASYRIPVGCAALAASITSDPPAPDELSNAIGLVLDHLEDVSREVPMIEFADLIHCTGFGIDIAAAVEVGGAVELPYELERAAAEEVFRTLATEARSDRALNPGLPSHMVHDVLATMVVLVSVLRFTQQQSVWLVAQ
ncbi:MAG: hypothetical protein RI900_3403 [Actinomycetota bacterium]